MLWAVSALRTRRGSRPQRDRHAFTLIEVLVATGLTLMLMAAVASIFVVVSENISGARATIEMSERVRATQLTLQKDLAGLTARGVPPLDPAQGLGYTEIIEGPVGPCGPPDTVQVVVGAPNSSSGDIGKVLFTPADEADANSKGQTFAPDTTVGDIDDILIFTTRSDDTPFTGRGGPSPASTPGNVQIIEAQSNVAEVCWFVRGRTLYRRVLLVDPTFDASVFTVNGQWNSNLNGYSYYGLSDLSVRQVGGTHDPTTVGDARLVANSLGDLTKRENRYGHPPMIQATVGGNLSTNWPHDARFWGALRLPTLRECSDSKWPLPFFDGSNTVRQTAGVVLPNGFPVHPTAQTFNEQPMVYFPVDERVRYDAWLEPRQWDKIDPATGGVIDIDPSVLTPAGAAQAPLRYPGTRYADDVILTNVVGFDVKVWDSGAPIFQTQMRIGVQDAPPQTVTVAPGDPGYFDELKKYVNDLSNPNFQPVARGAFVDLGWSVDAREWNGQEYAPPGAQFARVGNVVSALFGVPSDQRASNSTPDPDYRARVYDTGSSHYERDGIAQFVQGPRQVYLNQNPPDEASDGLDSDGNGIDDATEREAPPPYDAELKAIQVKIRVFEPDSRQVREVTVVQELVSQ